jgi:hypothetical protein
MLATPGISKLKITFFIKIPYPPIENYGNSKYPYEFP